MYAMLGTRPDIAFAVSLVSRYAANPNAVHWALVEDIFRYLKGTLSASLVYQGELENLKQNPSRQLGFRVRLPHL